MIDKQTLLEQNYEKKQRLYTWLMIVQSLTVFVILFLTIFTYANWPALSAEATYDWQLTQPQPSATPTVAPTIATVPTVAANPTKPTKTIIEAPHIVIPKIHVDAPITWNVPADKTVDYLDKGVAQLAGSATPGQVGNMFITGHSSDYIWLHNPYAAVFALVPKLVKGDTIDIKENGETFGYQVVQTQIVAPTDVQVTKPTTGAVLTLMTCYPVGTSQSRFVVEADLVSSPTPLTSSTQTDQGTLPEIQFR